MLKYLLLLVVASWVGYRAWCWWYSRTFAARSTEAMLRAWPTMSAISGGRRFLGSSAQLVYYRCTHSWLDNRARFLLLGRTDAGQWFEASVKVFGVRSISPFVIERELSGAEAQAWLAERQAHAQLGHYFRDIQTA